MCFAGSCQIGLQYEGLEVNQDYYFFNQTTAGSSGVIGLGPNSPYW
jgi:hypothetical protein